MKYRIYSLHAIKGWRHAHVVCCCIVCTVEQILWILQKVYKMQMQCTNVDATFKLVIILGRVSFVNMFFHMFALFTIVNTPPPYSRHQMYRQ